jgi:hypothetical protein
MAAGRSPSGESTDTCSFRLAVVVARITLAFNCSEIPGRGRRPTSRFVGRSDFPLLRTAFGLFLVASSVSLVLPGLASQEATGVALPYLLAVRP